MSCSPDSAPSDQFARIPAIDSLIQREIAADHIPGAVIQIKKSDSVLHRAAYGYAQKYNYGLKRLEDPVQMTTGHLFDLASLTKVMATTLGIMIMADNDALDLDDPVHKYLPEFKKGEKSEITIRHLLMHTSGLPQWVPTYYHASNAQERYQYIASIPLKWPVGAERHYSDLGFMLLGDIIEKISGQRLDEYLEKELYTPLNLEHTTFNPLNNKGLKVEAIAATSHGNPFEKQMVYDDSFGYQVDVDPEFWNNWREYTLRGEVNDGNSWYANNGVAGHAGLFSTIDDLQVLVDLLLERGKVNGRTFI
ncbi:serine hydrolase, partial [Fodinibius sp.]|uniref:serine hydrolase n=1 Tax=Fodinibius sp. TaxID=1872440 RepID=UPI003566615D